MPERKHNPPSHLLEPYRYIQSVPGKDIRSQLIDAFNDVWIKCDDVQVVDEIKEIVSQLHNASLLIDDIEDNSVLRRGIPVAHHIFGIPSTLNSANYVYFLAMEGVCRLGGGGEDKQHNTRAVSVFVQEILNLHRGQGTDIYWRDHNTSGGNNKSSSYPSEEEYCKMVLDKTGGLFRLAVGLLQAFSSKETAAVKDYTKLVNTLALYFQIRDDLINLADDDYMQNKSFCEDLTEGKLSFPILKCISTDLDDTRLVSILRQRTNEVEVKRYAQSLLLQSGSLHYTKEKCNALKDEALLEIESLGGNSRLVHILNALHMTVEACSLGSVDSAQNK